MSKWRHVVKFIFWFTGIVLYYVTIIPVILSVLIMTVGRSLSVLGDRDKNSDFFWEDFTRVVENLVKGDIL